MPSAGAAESSPVHTAHLQLSAVMCRLAPLCTHILFADNTSAGVVSCRWPLTEEPRLVLEACHVTKRVFASVSCSQRSTITDGTAELHGALCHHPFCGHMHAPKAHAACSMC